MKLHSNPLAALAAVLALFASVPLPAVADVTEAQIAAAKTPADHEAIAKSYDADVGSSIRTAISPSPIRRSSSGRSRCCGFPPRKTAGSCPARSSSPTRATSTAT